MGAVWAGRDAAPEGVFLCRHVVDSFDVYLTDCTSEYHSIHDLLTNVTDTGAVAVNTSAGRVVITLASAVVSIMIFASLCAKSGLPAWKTSPCYPLRLKNSHAN